MTFVIQFRTLLPVSIEFFDHVIHAKPRPTASGIAKSLKIGFTRRRDQERLWRSSWKNLGNLDAMVLKNDVVLVSNQRKEGVDRFDIAQVYNFDFGE